MTRLMIEAELKRRMWKLRLLLFLHKLQYSYDNADPADVGFWGCMAGLLFVQVLMFALMRR